MIDRANAQLVEDMEWEWDATNLWLRISPFVAMCIPDTLAAFFLKTAALGGAGSAREPQHLGEGVGTNEAIRAALPYGKTAEQSLNGKMMEG